jgi:hypothetical protein
MTMVFVPVMEYSSLDYMHELVQVPPKVQYSPDANKDVTSTWTTHHASTESIARLRNIHVLNKDGIIAFAPAYALRTLSSEGIPLISLAHSRYMYKFSRKEKYQPATTSATNDSQIFPKTHIDAVPDNLASRSQLFLHAYTLKLPI